jgi:cob(I)alamin adenosyltransferase
MSIYLYTGEGGGKTTTALGLALRSLGHGHKVIIIQYMKGRKDIGEYKFQNYLKNPNLYKVYQFGSPRFIYNLKNPGERNIQLARKGLEFVLEAVKQKPKLLVLDEINIVTAFGLLKTEDVIKTIKKIPKSIDVVLTGRYPPKQLMEIADYVNEMRFIKMPKKMIAKKGIQY